ncbi:TniB family NTP-binding protein [Reticulibacter mediterranei]|nr:TniB family NTP-binding protein [Reticulibacter mediterranei]
MNTDDMFTLAVDDQINVRQRLQQLCEWQGEWKKEDNYLAQRVEELSDSQLASQEGAQIGSLRRRLLLRQVRRPLEISPEQVIKITYPVLRQHLVEQFARLLPEERLLWLNNFLFIMTPDVRQLNDKIAKIRSYRSFGQQRNFLLGGESGMGKTTYLDWFTSNYLPVVESDRTRVPVIKIDAPEGNSPKPLFQRIILACGKNYLKKDNEEDLLMKVSLYFQKCGVEVLIVDEVEHIKSYGVRRRLLEVSNMTYGIPIICASCDPHRWTLGDSEVAGRWNDYFRLDLYKNERLQQLLLYINLLLPFTSDSFMLPDSGDPKKSSYVIDNGLVKSIEKWTRGKLRDVMILVVEASKQAIQESRPCLDDKLLERTWKSIQSKPLEENR